jgi:hypothetical protein
VLADTPADTLFLADICAAIGVSARILRECCEAHISPGWAHGENGARSLALAEVRRATLANPA